MGSQCRPRFLNIILTGGKPELWSYSDASNRVLDTLEVVNADWRYSALASPARAPSTPNCADWTCLLFCCFRFNITQNSLSTSFHISHANIQAYSFVTVYCMNCIIFLCVTPLFSLSFVPPLAPNPGDATDIPYRMELGNQVWTEPVQRQYVMRQTHPLIPKNRTDTIGKVAFNSPGSIWSICSVLLFLREK